MKADVHQYYHYQFLTLARNDERFMPYLLGTFSQAQRALPVDALFVNTRDEKVTFKIVPVNEIKAPEALITFLTGIRPALFPLTLGPTFSVLVLALTFGWEMHPWVIGSTLLAVFFWHGATFLLNDYHDHISGADLQSLRRGSRIIQRGWATAEQVKKWSMVCWLVGVILGLPAILIRPMAIVIIGATAALLMTAFSQMDLGTKNKSLGNVMIFLGMGPLLTSGVSLGVSGQMNMLVIVLGIIFGLGASLCIQLRHMESMLADSQSRVETFISRLGIDRSKTFILGQLLLVTVFLFLLVRLATPATINGLVLLPALGSTFRLGWRLMTIRSPVSSRLLGLWQEGLVLHLLIVVGSGLLFYLAHLGHF